jgi:hypothetical protein
MSDEKGNTREVTFDVWETDWSDLVGDLLDDLSNTFDVYNTAGGNYKVTIEFIPNVEESND